MATNQVMTVAPRPRARADAPPAGDAPAAAPTMLAMIAESTRMHSSPSRKTSTAISRHAGSDLVPGCSGSGVPWAVSALPEKHSHDEQRGEAEGEGGPFRPGLPGDIGQRGGGTRDRGHGM